MPISIRKPDDPIGGNRITLMRFKTPVGLRDPVARIRGIHELCIDARHEPAVAYTNAIAGALNVLPRTYVGGMLKHVDFLASNVPGIDVPVYLAGARVAEWYAFGPTIGAALNTTLVSYDKSVLHRRQRRHRRDSRRIRDDRMSPRRIRRDHRPRRSARARATRDGLTVFARPRCSASRIAR